MKIFRFVFLFALATLFSLPGSAESLTAMPIPAVAPPSASSAAPSMSQLRHRHRRRHRKHQAW